MKWNKFSEDSTCIIYRYEPSREAEYQLFFDKERCTCNYTLKRFVRNELMMTPQDAKNDWISHSAKYGHWEYEHPELELEILEFVMPIIQELNRKREERWKNDNR